MSDKIKRLNRELVYKGTILDIYKDTMDVGNGKIEEWDFVAHRKGAACIVPVLPDGRILMVRQYRNALERDTIEVPAGARDSVTEDTMVCAVREMEEETGYTSNKVSKLLSLRTTVQNRPVSGGYFAGYYNNKPNIVGQRLFLEV